ncbi:MAG: adenylosuccinate lyase [Bacteroidota bacterium]|nr:adenylosuccinate lyase [Bacteroidota bacterium]
MIARYTKPEMGRIWTDDNKFSIWLEIELLACEANAELGLIPKEAVAEMRAKAAFNTQKILEIEETTKHDVIAFLTNVEEYVGEPSRFIHLGMTSSDILDTCFAVQLKQAGELILESMNYLKEVLARRANEFKHTVCVGRTHGIHAEATTFGLKLALWYDECLRNIKRLKSSLFEVAVGKINGAVGTFEHLSPLVERYVCEKLGLEPALVTTQVISRDRHANFMSSLALCASMLEKIAQEIRHLQRTEVGEAEEYFSKGQKGSSAMPHKRNPIASENICGQARIIRSNLFAAIENNALWHERDISHSSVERVIFPDSTISLHYILDRTIRLLDKLVVYPDRMKQNLDLTGGLVFSQKVMLEIVKKGLKRQQAYELVQTSAMKAYNEKIKFYDALLENAELTAIMTNEEIEKLFSFDKLFENVDYIFRRLGL